MFYFGLDVHTTQITGCVLNSQGQVQQRRGVRDLSQLVRALESLSEPFQVCFEASCQYGWLSEALQKIAQKVVVLHEERHYRASF